MLIGAGTLLKRAGDSMGFLGDDRASAQAALEAAQRAYADWQARFAASTSPTKVHDMGLEHARLQSDLYLAQQRVSALPPPTSPPAPAPVMAPAPVTVPAPSPAPTSSGSGVHTPSPAFQEQPSSAGPASTWSGARPDGSDVISYGGGSSGPVKVAQSTPSSAQSSPPWLLLAALGVGGFFLLKNGAES